MRQRRPLRPSSQQRCDPDVSAEDLDHEKPLGATGHCAAGGVSSIVRVTQVLKPMQ